MFFRFDSLRVQVLAPAQCMRWQWQGHLSYHSFQRAFYQLLACSREQGVARWLVDTRHLPPVGTDEQAWLSEIWLPQFARLDIRTIGIVLPANLHNQLVIENVLADGRRHLRADIQFFSDIPSALDWLSPSPAAAQAAEQAWETYFGAADATLTGPRYYQRA